MDTEEKLKALLDLVDELAAIVMGHITDLNHVDRLVVDGQALRKKIQRLKQS